MGDCLAAGHLLFGTLDIDVDPLMVTGRVGEFVDLLLGHQVPVADPDLLALIGLHVASAFDFQHPCAPRSGPAGHYKTLSEDSKSPRVSGRAVWGRARRADCRQ